MEAEKARTFGNRRSAVQNPLGVLLEVTAGRPRSSCRSRIPSSLRGTASASARRRKLRGYRFFKRSSVAETSVMDYWRRRQTTRSPDKIPLSISSPVVLLELSGCGPKDIEVIELARHSIPKQRSRNKLGGLLKRMVFHLKFQQDFFIDLFFDRPLGEQRV